jgi:hypothetical protein
VIVAISELTPYQALPEESQSVIHDSTTVQYCPVLYTQRIETPLGSEFLINPMHTCCTGITVLYYESGHEQPGVCFFFWEGGGKGDERAMREGLGTRVLGGKRGKENHRTNLSRYTRSGCAHADAQRMSSPGRQHKITPCSIHVKKKNNNNTTTTTTNITSHHNNAQM